MASINLKSGLILGVFFVVIIVLVFCFGFNKQNSVESEYEDVTLLNDVVLFFSVDKNINKFISYIDDKNDLAVLGVLDSNYAYNNNLNNNNVIDYLSNYSNLVFSSYETYVISRNNFYNFFVSGYLKKDDYNSYSVIVDKAYFKINLDIEKFRYSIEIINDDLFNKYVSDNKFSYNKFEGNEYNLFDYDTIEEKNLPIIYFNDFYNNLYSNSKLAYDSIINDTKEKYFPTFDSFVDKIRSGYFNDNEFAGYNIDDGFYSCRDTSGNIYYFVADGVMDYKVKIDFVK